MGNTKPKEVEAVKKSKEEVIAETVLALITTKTNGQAAERIGISEDGLYKRLRTIPEIREGIAKVPEMALSRLQANSVDAAEVMVDEFKNRMRRLEAAKEVLSLVGLKGTSPMVAVQVNTYGNLTDEQLDQVIESKARKARSNILAGGEAEESQAGSA